VYNSAVPIIVFIVQCLSSRIFSKQSRSKFDVHNFIQDFGKQEGVFEGTVVALKYPYVTVSKEGLFLLIWLSFDHAADSLSNHWLMLRQVRYDDGDVEDLEATEIQATLDSSLQVHVIAIAIRQPHSASNVFFFGTACRGLGRDWKYIDFLSSLSFIFFATKNPISFIFRFSLNLSCMRDSCYWHWIVVRKGFFKRQFEEKTEKQQRRDKKESSACAGSSPTKNTKGAAGLTGGHSSGGGRGEGGVGAAVAAKETAAKAASPAKGWVWQSDNEEDGRRARNVEEKGKAAKDNQKDSDPASPVKRKR